MLKLLSVKNGLLALAAIAVVAQIGTLAFVQAVGASWGATAGAAGVSATLVLAVAYIAGQHYALRANAIVDALHHLAAGDLTHKPQVPGKDDFSWIAWEFNCARKSLLQLVNELVRQSEQISTAAGTLANASDEISRNAGEQNQSVSGIASAVEHMSASVTQVAENARSARDLTVSASAISEQGSSAMRNVATEVGHIAQAVQDSSAMVDELGRKSGEIRQIISVIRDVAEQTNLLALNAAIEAARAGEQGRGFAVVADEVRKLAERTAASTREISRMVEAIGDGTSRVVSSMEQGVTRVNKGVSLAQDAGRSIMEVNENARLVASSVADITRAIEEHRSATGAITTHIDHIVRMEESSHESTLRVRDTAHRMNTVAADLSASVARFKV